MAERVARYAFGKTGFLESIYHSALKIEFRKQGIAFESEKEVKVI